jgi:hypothetical protein
VANERNTTIKTSQKIVLSIMSNPFTVDHHSVVGATNGSFEADTSWMLGRCATHSEFTGTLAHPIEYGDRVVGMRGGKEVVIIGKA